MNLPQTYVKRIEGQHHQRHRSIYNPSHTPHHAIHVYGTVFLVYILHVIQSSSHPTYISMHVIPSHREHTRQRQRHEHTHTRTHNTTHTTQPARQRHHLGTATHGTTSASRSANITQRDTLPKGRGNLKIFRSARGQSTSHIFWVFHMGSPFLFFLDFL